MAKYTLGVGKIICGEIRIVTSASPYGGGSDSSSDIFPDTCSDDPYMLSDEISDICDDSSMQW